MARGAWQATVHGVTESGHDKGNFVALSLFHWLIYNVVLVYNVLC